jgi:hypothetical protein
MPLSSLAALFLRYAPDKFSLTKPNTSCRIEMPAPLRSDGVRVYPGMPFGFLSETAFGLAGILSKGAPPAKYSFRMRRHPTEFGGHIRGKRHGVV